MDQLISQKGSVIRLLFEIRSGFWILGGLWMGGRDGGCFV